MPDYSAPCVIELPPMRVAAYWTYTEAPAEAFAVLDHWAKSRGLACDTTTRWFGFPNPDPFGPGFEAWRTVVGPVRGEGRIRIREVPAGLQYATAPSGWAGDLEEWVRSNTPGFGLQQSMHEYRLGGDIPNLAHVEKIPLKPVAAAELPGDLDIVEAPPRSLASVSFPDLDGFLRWFHAFVGRHPEEERSCIQLFQAPGEGAYDVWVVPATSALIYQEEGAQPLECPGGRYAHVITSEVCLPEHIGKGWDLARDAGLQYDGSRRFLIEPFRQLNTIDTKHKVRLWYPVV